MIVYNDKQYIKSLYEAFSKIKTEDEFSALMEDLCTIKEIHSIGQRLEVAKLLSKEVPYVTIAEKTGASTATICRVAKALNYGAGGYTLVIDKEEKK